MLCVIMNIFTSCSMNMSINNDKGFFSKVFYIHYLYIIYHSLKMNSCLCRDSWHDSLWLYQTLITIKITGKFRCNEFYCINNIKLFVLCLKSFKKKTIIFNSMKWFYNYFVITTNNFPLIKPFNVFFWNNPLNLVQIASEKVIFPNYLP